MKKILSSQICSLQLNEFQNKHFSTHSAKMSLLEETYKKFDPEGELNLGFDDLEVRSSQVEKKPATPLNGLSNTKNRFNILDA